MAEETGWREGGEFLLAVVPADALGIGRYAPFLSQAFYLQAMGDACLLIWGTREGFSSIPLQATAIPPQSTQSHTTISSRTILAMLVASGTALLVPFSVTYWRYGYSLFQAVGLSLLLSLSLCRIGSSCSLSICRHPCIIPYVKLPFTIVLDSWCAQVPISEAVLIDTRPQTLARWLFSGRRTPAV